MTHYLRGTSYSSQSLSSSYEISKPDANLTTLEHSVTLVSIYYIDMSLLFCHNLLIFIRMTMLIISIIFMLVPTIGLFQFINLFLMCIYLPLLLICHNFSLPFITFALFGIKYFSLLPCHFVTFPILVFNILNFVTSNCSSVMLANWFLCLQLSLTRAVVFTLKPSFSPSFIYGVCDILLLPLLSSQETWVCIFYFLIWSFSLCSLRLSDLSMMAPIWGCSCRLPIPCFWLTTIVKYDFYLWMRIFDLIRDQTDIGTVKSVSIHLWVKGMWYMFLKIGNWFEGWPGDKTSGI